MSTLHVTVFPARILRAFPPPCRVQADHLCSWEPRAGSCLGPRRLFASHVQAQTCPQPPGARTRFPVPESPAAEARHARPPSRRARGPGGRDVRPARSAGSTQLSEESQACGVGQPPVLGHAAQEHGRRGLPAARGMFFHVARCRLPLRNSERIQRSRSHRARL